MPIGEDYTLVLATLYVLSKQPGPVVANLSTTTALEDVARRFACPVFLTRIGEVNVTEVMEREHAVIGGEGNGGVIYPRINFARDSLVGMALVLHLLAQTGKTITELLNDIPKLHMIKEKVVCPSQKIRDVLRMIRRVYADAPMDLTDGVKVVLPHAWLHVRGSNTEPIMRISAEAQTEEEVRQISASVFGLIQECVKS